MRKVENQAVAALLGGDAGQAHSALTELLTFDRRRAWWALFRAAAAIPSEDRRAAMIALVSRTYIARRVGQIVGVPDEPVVSALAGWLILRDWDRTSAALTKVECRHLERWLPARVHRLLAAPPP